MPVLPSKLMTHYLVPKAVEAYELREILRRSGRLNEFVNSLSARVYARAKIDRFTP